MLQTTPMFPGDFHSSAAAIAADEEGRLSLLVDAEERDAALRDAWNRLGELGWPSLMVAEEFDGLGGSLVDLAAVAEGIGTAALPLPVVTACGLAPAVLTACDASEVRDNLLCAIARATARVVPAFAGGDLAVSGGASKRTLDGSIGGVETVPDTTHYLVIVEEPDTRLASVFVVGTDAAGLSVNRRQRLDGRDTVDLSFGGVSVAGHACLADSGIDVDAIRDEIALITGAELIGAIGSVLEQTVAHLMEREQFDAPLSSQQVLRHQVAELFIAYENTRALVHSSIDRLQGPQAGSRREIGLVRLRLADVARTVALAAIQLHGGIGMTEEVQVARLAKRLLAAEFDHGGNRGDVLAALLREPV